MSRFAYWHKVTWQRWSVAVVAAFATVAVVANILKLVIEATTDIAYVIHWLETVPVITLLFAYVYRKMWRTDGKPKGAGSEVDASDGGASLVTDESE